HAGGPVVGVGELVGARRPAAAEELVGGGEPAGAAAREVAADPGQPGAERLDVAQLAERQQRHHHRLLGGVLVAAAGRAQRGAVALDEHREGVAVAVAGTLDELGVGHLCGCRTGGARGYPAARTASAADEPYAASLRQMSASERFSDSSSTEKAAATRCVCSGKRRSTISRPRSVSETEAARRSVARRRRVTSLRASSVVTTSVALAFDVRSRARRMRSSSSPPAVVSTTRTEKPVADSPSRSRSLDRPR